MQPHKRTIVDRRSKPPEKSEWWSKLSLAQKFSASSLGKFGYELSFVRNDNGKSLAVLICHGGGVAVVSEDGSIDTSPNIELRKQC